MPLTRGGPLDFTDGDNFKRVTITDPTANPRSIILAGIERNDVTDSDDGGWVFAANVVSRGEGSFEVNVAAFVLGDVPINDEGPNELVDLVYLIQ